MASEKPAEASAPSNAGAKDEPDNLGSVRFSPEEEKKLMEESAEKKTKANELFNAGNCEEALVQYEEALSSCPDYKHFERAVIHSNISACQIKLEEWTAASKAATKALDTLVTMERELGLIPEAKKETPKDDAKDDAEKDATETEDKDNAPKVETKTKTEPTVADEVDTDFVPADVPDATKNDIKRIRIKALLRRGRARSEAGGWSNLSGAEEDYKTLSKIPGLSAADTKTVRMQLVTLPPRSKAAQEKEMSEMWGKLRQLGDGILKPFGLSTNNFQMVKDDATGGYSMNFQGNQGS